MTPLPATTLEYLALVIDMSGARGFWPHRHRDLVPARMEYRYRQRLLRYGLIEAEHVPMRNQNRAHARGRCSNRVVVTATPLGRAMIASYRAESNHEQAAAK